MNDFWFILGCRILCSCLYDEDGLDLAKDELITLENELSRTYHKNPPGYKKLLKTKCPEIFNKVVGRLGFFVFEDFLPIDLASKDDKNENDLIYEEWIKIFMFCRLVDGGGFITVNTQELINLYNSRDLYNVEITVTHNDEGNTIYSYERN